MLCLSNIIAINIIPKKRGNNNKRQQQKLRKTLILQSVSRTRWVIRYQCVKAIKPSWTLLQQRWQCNSIVQNYSKYYIYSTLHITVKLPPPTYQHLEKRSSQRLGQQDRWFGCWCLTALSAQINYISCHRNIKYIT